MMETSAPVSLLHLSDLLLLPPFRNTHISTTILLYCALSRAGLFRASILPFPRDHRHQFELNNHTHLPFDPLHIPNTTTSIRNGVVCVAHPPSKLWDRRSHLSVVRGASRRSPRTVQEPRASGLPPTNAGKRLIITINHCSKSTPYTGKPDFDFEREAPGGCSSS